ncbi:MAG TPA: cytochrome b [Rhizomicrobium sp.]|jgi:cytochrome b561|nr:cytochrome b [Rhizomicrobium sp.]
MTVRNNYLRYGTVAMTLHWLIAAGIIFMLCFGLYIALLPHGDPSLFPLVQLHKSIGLTILVLSLLRVMWRLINPVPPLPDTLSPALKVVARATHVFLYFLILAIPLSGWAMVSAARLPFPTMYFGLFEWPHISFIASLPLDAKTVARHTFSTTHLVLAIMTAVLLVLHVGAALQHHFVYRDDTLKRMLPGTKVRGEA